MCLVTAVIKYISSLLFYLISLHSSTKIYTNIIPTDTPVALNRHLTLGNQPKNNTTLRFILPLLLQNLITSPSNSDFHLRPNLLMISPANQRVVSSPLMTKPSTGCGVPSFVFLDAFIMAQFSEYEDKVKLSLILGSSVLLLTGASKTGIDSWPRQR